TGAAVELPVRAVQGDRLGPDIGDLRSALHQQRPTSPAGTATDEHGRDLGAVRSRTRSLHAGAATAGTTGTVLDAHPRPGAGNRVPIRGTGVPATGRTPHRSRRARTVRGRRELQYRSRRPRDLRAERRTAHARVRRPRPRDGGVPQLPHHQRATRTLVLPDRTPDRFPTVRRPHHAGRIGGRCRMTMPTRHTTPSSVYQRWDARLGLFTLRPVDPPTDTPLLHRWLTDPKSAYWLMTHATPDEVEREFTEIALAAGRKAFLGLYRNRPEFLVETYAPLR